MRSKTYAYKTRYRYRRKTVAIDPGRAFINANAAGFFVIDGDFQEYPNKVPDTSDAMTLGSNAVGVDTNDPTIVEASGSFYAAADGADDYIQFPASCTPTFTATSGGYTVLARVRRDGNGGGGTAAVIDAESTFARGLRVQLSSGINPAATVGGTGGFATDTATVTSTDQAFTVIGAVQDDGVLTLYNQIEGLGPTPVSTASVGTIAFATPRAFSYAYTVGINATLDGSSFVFFQQALTEEEIDLVIEYLETLI